MKKVFIFAVIIQSSFSFGADKENKTIMLMSPFVGIVHGSPKDADADKSVAQILIKFNPKTMRKALYIGQECDFYEVIPGKEEQFRAFFEVDKYRAIASHLSTRSSARIESEASECKAMKE